MTHLDDRQAAQLAGSDCRDSEEKQDGEATEPKDERRQGAQLHPRKHNGDESQGGKSPWIAK